MSPNKSKRRNKIVEWVRWFLFSEGLILLLALAGPGKRYWHSNRENHDLLARLIVDDPTYLGAVLVNFIALHIFIGSVFLAAWFVARLRGVD